MNEKNTITTKQNQTFVMSETAEKLDEKNAKAISLLDFWLRGDEKEQKETWDFLKKSLDEDRLSDRKFYQ